jgi:hypothetical protein
MRRLTGAVCLAVALAACSDPPVQLVDAAPRPDATPSDAAPVPVPDAGLTGTPDLAIDLSRARVDLAVDQRVFALDSCELNEDELCIGGEGTRDLLHFAVETPNLGDGDLRLGAPDEDNENFEYSMCHNHWHYGGYATYRLLDELGEPVATGRKQAFCLLDSERYVDEPDVALSPKYRCDYQGIQHGWADVYHTRLPCQWVDVTGVAPGEYTLEIELNAEHTLEELDYDNNLVSIPVTLGAGELGTPTEACAEDLDARATRGDHRECGWTLDQTVACTPGSTVDVGCAGACGLGSCTGDPMLRVCDADRPDGNCSYPGAIGLSDDFGGQCPCKLGILCPDSGSLAVYTASFDLEAPYTCELEFDL